MAQLVCIDAHAHATGAGLAELRRLRADDRPDLTGGHVYVRSDRHAAYVESGTYQRVLAEFRDQFGWADPTETFYVQPGMDVRSVPDAHVGSPR